MGEVAITNRPLKWTITASACLHAGVALLLAWKVSHTTTPVIPLGIDVFYAGEVSPASQATAAHRPRVSAPPRRRTPPVVAEPKATESLAPRSPVAAAGTGASSPTAAASGPAGARDGSVVSALERYKYELRLFLESRKIYPETAKRLHMTGTVVVNFKVDNQGQLLDVQLEQASDSDILNRAAVDLVKRAPRFKPVPAEIRVSELQLSLPIEYIL